MADNQQLYNQISIYLRTKGVRRAAVFGSFARNEETLTSDIDLLVEIVPGMTLFDILRMEDELEQLTCRKIDLVDYRTIKPLLRDSVFSATIPLL